MYRLERGRSREESDVLYHIPDSVFSRSTMNGNGCFLYMAYLHLCALPNAMGIMERLCFSALSPGVVELWNNSQPLHLKACHQMELSTLHHHIQTANGRVPGNERRARNTAIVPRVCAQ